MSEALAQKHCVPCEGGTPALSSDSIQSLLGQIKGWQPRDDKALEKSFKFKDFLGAVDFVNAVTPVAEAEGHHPDLFVKWGEVRVSLTTHAVGGLTENDFILAAKIDQLQDRRQAGG